MKLTVTHNFPEVKAAIERLDADIRTRATVSAVNKTMDQAKTRMTREITSTYAVTAGYVRERLRVRGASSKPGSISIEATLIGGDGRRRSANIIRFLERVTTLAQAKKRAKAGTLNQLFVKIKKAGGAKALKGAFIGNKGRTVFRRTGKSRLPIEPVQVIDVGQMFNSRNINGAVLQFIQQKFPEVFAREASYFTQRFGGR